MKINLFFTLFSTIIDVFVEVTFSMPSLIESSINGVPPAAADTLGTAYAGPFGVATIPSSDFKVLWPIPLLETTVNPTLAAQQNPGW